MKVRLAREMAETLVPERLRSFYGDVMERKHDDHHASHLIAIGQTLNAGVFYQLGSVGVFYGNRFGHDVEWCRGFPFRWWRTRNTSARAIDLGVVPRPPLPARRLAGAADPRNDVLRGGR
jgi:hypothetical protein